MCVIIVMESSKITRSNLEKCENANKDGGGVSWVEEGKVRWEKGLTSKEIMKIVNNAPLPIVAHFRISTIGGTPKSLTHPFPVTDDCSLKLSGSAERVLYHNGSWTNWDEVCLNMITSRNITMPKGEWSDSRALAWLVAKSNDSFLSMTGQKIAIHDKDCVWMFGSFTKKEGIYYSNMFWDYKRVEYPKFKYGFGEFGNNNSYGNYGGPIGFQPELDDKPIGRDELRNYLDEIERLDKRTIK